MYHTFVLVRNRNRVFDLSRIGRSKSLQEILGELGRPTVPLANGTCVAYIRLTARGKSP